MSFTRPVPLAGSVRIIELGTGPGADTLWVTSGTAASTLPIANLTICETPVTATLQDTDLLFDSDYYLAANPDVEAAGVNPLLQYEQSGWMQGRNPSAATSTNKYLAANPDVAAAHVDPLLR